VASGAAAEPAAPAVAVVDDRPAAGDRSTPAVRTGRAAMVTRRHSADRPATTGRTSRGALDATTGPRSRDDRRIVRRRIGRPTTGRAAISPIARDESFPTARHGVSSLTGRRPIDRGASSPTARDPITSPGLTARAGRAATLVGRTTRDRLNGASGRLGINSAAHANLDRGSSAPARPARGSSAPARPARGSSAPARPVRDPSDRRQPTRASTSPKVRSSSAAGARSRRRSRRDARRSACLSFPSAALRSTPS
jgi:hypothetical protein